MRPEVVLTHEFVECIPEELREGTVYVCIRFATAAHRCCCGCGREVVTPLSPTDWKLIFDGVSVSLHPSIGNWNFPCRSHYWIQHGKARRAGRWSQEMIEAGRTADAQAKARYFGGDDARAASTTPSPEMATESDEIPKMGDPGGEAPEVRIWRKILEWMLGT